MLWRSSYDAEHRDAAEPTTYPLTLWDWMIITTGRLRGFCLGDVVVVLKMLKMRR